MTLIVTGLNSSPLRDQMEVLRDTVAQLVTHYYGHPSTSNSNLFMNLVGRREDLYISIFIFKRIRVSAPR